MTTFRAGVAEVDITPPMGVEMWGYGPYEKRVCTEVLDPLAARALWLEAGGTAVALITADLGSITQETRDAVARRLREATGLPAENLLVAASHTHSGPATQWVVGWGEVSPGYLKQLEDSLVEAALRARASLEPARVGACCKRVGGVGVNREQPELGPLDTAAQLLRVDRADGKPLAVAFNFGAHAVVRYPYTSRISADWPGLAAAYLRTVFRGAVPLFLQGCSGNINGHDMTFAREDPVTQQRVCDLRVGDVAKRFADQVLPALEALKTEPSASLGAIFTTVDLACEPPDPGELRQVLADNRAVADRRTLADLRPLHERLATETEEERAWRVARFNVDWAAHQLKLLDEAPPAVKAPLQVLRVGGAAIVAWPGEIFVELGLEVRQRSPIRPTFVASFANGNVGYIPTEAAYESQGKPHEFGRYPTRITPHIYGRMPFRPEAGRILVEATLRLLERWDP